MKFLLKASEEKEHFFDLIYTEVTFANDIIYINGNVMHEKGEKAFISDVEYKPGYWSGLCPDIYVQPQISSFKINGVPGKTWKPDTFVEYKKQTNGTTFSEIATLLELVYVHKIEEKKYQEGIQQKIDAAAQQWESATQHEGLGPAIFKAGVDYAFTCAKVMTQGEAQSGAVWVKAKGGMPAGIYSMKLMSRDNVEMRGTGLVNHGVIQLITFLNKSTMGIDDLPKDYEGVYYLDEPAAAGKETEWDSVRMIGRVKDRFKELEEKQWDWRSFYGGWLEGRADMLQQVKGHGRLYELSQQQADLIREANSRDLGGVAAGREEVDPQELWDEFSEYINNDIDSCQDVAGSAIMTEASFKKAFMKFKQQKKK